MRMNVAKSNFHQDIAALIRTGNPEQAGQIRKAAIGATSSTSVSGDFDYQVNADYYLAQEHNPDGLLRWLVRWGNPGRIGIPPFVGSGISAFYIGEGLGIPVSQYSAAGTPLGREKVAGIVVVQKDAWQYAEIIAAIERALVQAVRLAEDQRFLALFTAGADAVFGSSGDLLHDVGAALAAVNRTAFGNMAFVMHPILLNVAATAVAVESGLPLFPDLDPVRGGSMLGITVIPSEAAGDDLYLINANDVCVSDEGLTLRLSDNAPIEMADSSSQDSAAPTGTTGSIVSAFQVDAVALLGLRSFGFRLIRPTGCAVITNVIWSGTTTSSTQGA